MDDPMQTSFTPDQVLRLYEVETRQVHASLDQIIKIRGTIAIAFAAILSATLYYRVGIIALGSVIFLAAWYWEYVYARYMGVYKRRVEAMQVWISSNLFQLPDVSGSYGPRSGYDHRVTYPVVKHIKARLKLGPPSDFVAIFFDLPRALLYSSMTFSPIVLAALLRFPWGIP